MKSKIVLFVLLIGILTILLPAIANVQPTESVLGYWNFDEGSGAIAHDNSTYANHGEIHNAIWVSGISGSALYFNGTDDSYVEVPDKPELTPTRRLIIEAWIKPESYPTSYMAIIYKGDLEQTGCFGERSYSLWACSDGRIHFTWTPEGENCQLCYFTAAGLTPLNQWSCVKVDLDTTVGKLLIYVNGTKALESDCPCAPIKIGDSPLRIGGMFRSLSDQSNFRGSIDEVELSSSLSFRVAELAKEVIGADYLWGGKGFTKYYVGDEGIVKLLNEEQIESLDCSGLIFWSYNRAYYDDKEIFAGWRGEKQEGDWENRPVYWYGANMQYYGNVGSINKEDLSPGDLLFFDTDDNATMDHVAMYVGPFMYDSTEYNVIHAEGVSTEKITPATYNSETEEVITPGAATLEVTAYGRVKDAKKPEFKAISGSPVDLIVTDPEGETITKEMGESLTMEYVTYDIDGDGELDDIVASPERKIGNYSIEVVPEPNALPTDTYSLQVTIDDQTMVLAKDVQIEDIPEDPYEVESKICYSDFDDDNDVDFVDYAIFASRWFEQNCNYPAWCGGTDLDYSGSVDINDLAIFTEHWLEGSVP